MFAGYFVIELRCLSRRFGLADCLDVGLGQILDGNCPAVATFLAGRGDVGKNVCHDFVFGAAGILGCRLDPREDGGYPVRG